MFCENCSLDNLPGLFCSQCGGPLVAAPEKCPSCGNKDASGNYCNECGSSLSLHNCPSCGAKNQTDHYCRDCGVRISGIEPPAIKTQGAIEVGAADLLPWQEEIAYCGNCYQAKKKYESPGVLVTRCTACGAEANNIKF